MMYFVLSCCVSSLAFVWSPVVCSKHPLRAMCCPVNMYCGRDISCIVIVTYYVLISVLLVSYVVSIQCRRSVFGVALYRKHQTVVVHC